MQEYHELFHKKKGLFLFRWCTRTENTLDQYILTFGIHLMTMVGQAIHGGAAINGRNEPSLAIVWTHFESFVRGTIVWEFALFLTCMSTHILSFCICFIQRIGDGGGREEAWGERSTGLWEERPGWQRDGRRGLARHREGRRRR